MSSVTETGVYYGFAQVSPGKEGEHLLSAQDSVVHPMVMSLGWNPFYKNKQMTAVCCLSSCLGHEVFTYCRPIGNPYHA